MDAVEPPDRRVQIVESAIGDLSGDLGADPERPEGLVDDQETARFGHRLADRFDVERGDRPRVDQLDGDPLGRQLLRDLERSPCHQGQGDDGHVASGSDDGRLAEFDLVIVLGDVLLRRQQLAMLEEHDRVVRSQGPVEQALGVVRRRGNHDPQTGEMGKQGIIVARMVRRRRMADADAAAQQDGHFDPPAAHVLHLGDLVQDLAERIEDEVGKHEVDDGAGADHCRAAPQADEAAFADRRVAQPVGPEAVVTGRTSCGSCPPVCRSLRPSRRSPGSVSISKVRASRVACIQVASRAGFPAVDRSAGSLRAARAGA